MSKAKIQGNDHMASSANAHDLQVSATAGM